MLNLSGDRAKYWKRLLMHIAQINMEKYRKMQIGMKLLPAPPSQRASWCVQARCAQLWWRRALPGYLLKLWPKAILCPPQRWPSQYFAHLKSNQGNTLPTSKVTKSILCPPQRCGCWCWVHRRAKTLPHHIHQHRGRAESGVQNSVSKDNCVAEKKSFKELSSVLS